MARVESSVFQSRASVQKQRILGRWSRSLFSEREMKVRQHQMFERVSKQLISGVYGLLNLWRTTAVFLTVTVSV